MILIIYGTIKTLVVAFVLLATVIPPSLARQAVKNTPRRMPSVAVGSPPGEASLNPDQSVSDTPIPTPDEPSSTVSLYHVPVSGA